MPHVYIESLGCARNQVDSEIMVARLKAAHWVLTQDPATADAIVVNTCSFIQSAADESIDTILALAQYKHQGRCRCLIVAGCLPQRYGQETLAAMPEVDVLLGTGAYDKIVDAISQVLPQGTCLLPDPDSLDVRPPALRESFDSHSAYLKIAEGCDRHCTYCIIPRLRGHQKSRPVETLIIEARDLIARGVKELTLVAQETSAYGRDLKPTTDLAFLLENLARLDSSVWIRFLYAHPLSLTAEMIATVAAHDNLCPYFDIPIQHASDAVLHHMGRSYGADDLRRLFGSIRRAIPQAALRTTLIVGFPGETQEDFNRLSEFVQEIEFDHLGVFTYSDADDLPSHGLPAHVPARVARKRQAAIMALQQEISTRRLNQWLGTVMAVLVEEHPEPELYVARSARQAPEVDGSTMIRSNKPLSLGSFVDVRISDTWEYDLVGEPL
jgi:ribosomal protein S12 methylthiotransferase